MAQQAVDLPLLGQAFITLPLLANHPLVDLGENIRQLTRLMEEGNERQRRMEDYDLRQWLIRYGIAPDPMPRTKAEKLTMLFHHIGVADD
ncbi:hypothetical protein FRC06_007689 [Ceratobasidium sp. 370]|nr:hypothetical protein FRC06_007689 [Ceratobasidium sp. 370]